jgi:hypothetical protein
LELSVEGKLCFFSVVPRVSDVFGRDVEEEFCLCWVEGVCVDDGLVERNIIEEGLLSLGFTDTFCGNNGTVGWDASTEVCFFCAAAMYVVLGALRNVELEFCFFSDEDVYVDLTTGRDGITVEFRFFSGEECAVRDVEDFLVPWFGDNFGDVAGAERADDVAFPVFCVFDDTIGRGVERDFWFLLLCVGDALSGRNNVVEAGTWFLCNSDTFVGPDFDVELKGLARIFIRVGRTPMGSALVWFMKLADRWDGFFLGLTW